MARAFARPRLTGSALAVILAVVAGCSKAPDQAALPSTTTASGPSALTPALVSTGSASLDTSTQTAVGTTALTSAATGRVEIHVTGLAAVSSYHVQALVSQIATLQVTLSGGGLTSPLVQQVSASSLSSGAGTITFDPVVPGSVNVAIQALDASGASLGTTTSTTTVTAGQTSTMALSMKLDPTHVTNANGALSIDLSVADGDVVIDPVASASATPSPTTDATPTPTPAPTATPTPTPTPTPVPTVGVVDLLSTPTLQWFTNHSMAVKGTVQNTWSVPMNAKVTVTFIKKTLWSTATEETQVKDLGSIPANSHVDFVVNSIGSVSNIWGDGDATVDVSTY